MGIFKDLGFTNRNGEVEVPNAETIAGLSIEEFKNSFLPPKIVNDADGLIQIQGSALPKTITQEAGQSNWVKYQASVKPNIVSFNKTIYSSAPAANDQFGGSCAIGATFMLIGSYYDRDKGTDAGKAEMFDLNGNFIKTIYSNQPAADDYFGTSCAIGSTFMLIGSDGDDDNGIDAGKVEMFDLDGNYIKTIYSNQPGASDGFGISCAIGSTFMLIGSYNDDDKGADAGKVEMFDLDGNFIKTIYSNQPDAGDLFGRSCAIGSTFMLIGSQHDADKGAAAGKVEMFDLNGNYIKTIYSNRPAASDQFGVSCAIGSTLMLIGSPSDDDKGANAGKVEMFAIDTSKTIFEKYFSNSNTLFVENEGSVESVEINFFE